MSNVSKNIGTLQDKNGNSLFPIGIETINNDNGTAYKFPDGTMICTGSMRKSVSITNSWGSLYSSHNGNFIFNDFAQAFVDIPRVSYGFVYSNFAFFIGVDQGRTPTETSPGGVQLFRGNQYTGNAEVSYIAIGRWKETDETNG